MVQRLYEKRSKGLREIPSKIVNVNIERFLGLATCARDPPGPQIDGVGSQIICFTYFYDSERKGFLYGVNVIGVSATSYLDGAWATG